MIGIRKPKMDGTDTVDTINKDLSLGLTAASTYNSFSNMGSTPKTTDPGANLDANDFDRYQSNQNIADNAITRRMSAMNSRYFA